MVHTKRHKRSSDPAQRFEDKVKRKRDKEQARDARIAERDIAGGKFQAEGKAVSRFDIERIKRETGTSQQSQQDIQLQKEKAEALRVGIRERGDILTPDIRGQIVERTVTQEAQVPALQEAGVFEERPTEQEDLLKPITTEEGIEQFKIEAGSELVEQRLIKFGGTIGFKQQIVNGIQDTVGAGIFSVKTAGDVFGDVAIVGDIITGITGDRGEIVQNIQSSLEARNQMAAKIGTLVKEGSMDSTEGFRALARMEQEMEADISILKREAILSPAVRRSGEIIDIQVDLLELSQEIFDAKRVVAGGALQETDPFILSERLDELDKLK